MICRVSYITYWSNNCLFLRNRLNAFRSQKKLQIVRLPRVKGRSVWNSAGTVPTPQGRKWMPSSFLSLFLSLNIQTSVLGRMTPLPSRISLFSSAESICNASRLLAGSHLRQPPRFEGRSNQSFAKRYITEVQRHSSPTKRGRNGELSILPAASPIWTTGRSANQIKPLQRFPARDHIPNQQNHSNYVSQNGRAVQSKNPSTPSIISCLDSIIRWIASIKSGLAFNYPTTGSQWRVGCYSFGHGQVCPAVDAKMKEYVDTLTFRSST